MATASSIQMADAIVEELNSSERVWSESFTAVRKYLPVGRMSSNDFKNLVVTVMPREYDAELATRSGTESDITIDIGIQKHTGSLTEYIDPLVYLGEQFANLFRNEVLTGADGIAFTCFEAKLSPVYVPEHLERFGVYTGIVTVKAKTMG